VRRTTGAGLRGGGARPVDEGPTGVSGGGGVGAACPDPERLREAVGESGGFGQGSRLGLGVL
jgi:hypothetical protein